MKMQKYKISLVKEYEKQGKKFDKQLSKTPNFRSLKSFKTSESFSYASNDKQKRFIRKQLNMIRKKDLDFDVNEAEVGKKERIMVFEKGNYEMDEAVYDSQTKIPKHLRASKKQKVKKQDG